MIRFPSFSLDAVWGAVPNNSVDNQALLSELVGPDKAAAVVKSTGFATRRAMPSGGSVYDLMLAAARVALKDVDPQSIGGLVVVTFSSPERFPALSIRLQAALGLSPSVAALDLQLACGGYPYGLMVAGQLAASTGKRVLLLDGDVQSAHVDGTDPTTLAVMSDAATATLVSAPKDEAAPACFAFYTDGNGANVLRCGADGKIRMDGFGVFRFVAGPVVQFLRDFLAEVPSPKLFVPHQANLYMVRQLAKSLRLEAQLLTSGERFANPGSCSVPLTLAAHPSPLELGWAVLAGFGAGLAASAVSLVVPPACRRGIVEVDVLSQHEDPSVVPVQRMMEL